MMNPKKFFYRLMIFAIIFVAADQLFGIVFMPVFKLQERGKYFTTSYAIKGSTEPIVIFGNSHAAQHFNANRITDSLQANTFNFGNQSQSILYYYPLMESVLLHHSPQLIILNLDPEELLYNKMSYERLSVLLPYRNENSYIDAAINRISKLEKFKAFSNFYRFNSTIGYVCLNLFSKSYGKSVSSRGYDPQSGSLCKLNVKEDASSSEDAKDKKSSDTMIDTMKVQFIHRIIDDLKRRNINLLVTFAPVYKSEIKNRSAFNKLTSILSENQVEYCNFYNDKRFSNDCTLFNDQNHLNTTGADIFTDVIIREIRERKLLLPVSATRNALSKTN